MVLWERPCGWEEAHSCRHAPRVDPRTVHCPVKGIQIVVYWCQKPKHALLTYHLTYVIWFGHLIIF